VDAYDDKALSTETLIPIHQPGDRTFAIDSAIGPKLQEDHLATEIRHFKRRRVNPDFIVDLWSRPADQPRFRTGQRKMEADYNKKDYLQMNHPTS